MIRKLYSTLAVFLIGTTFVLAQSGEMKVKVVDKTTKQGIPFAAVVVENGGSQVGSGQTDFDGIADIKPIPPGKYDVKIQVLGYNPLQISGILVNADRVTEVPAAMDNGNGVQLKTFTKVEYKVPLIDKDVKTGGDITKDDYTHMASKDLGSVASTVPGIYQQDEGTNISIRGARPSGSADAGEESTTAIYIDGQRVRGSSNLPQSDIEQISVITGGVPAQYGDATGGVINITTKGPESKYFGGVEAVSSQLTDSYGYNLFDFSFGGPIITKKDTITHTKRSVLGFIITGQVEHDLDPSPSAVGAYQVNSDVLSKLEANPISPASNGAGFVRNTEFVTANDLTHINARQNVGSTEFIVSGKLDYAPSKNITFTLGGSEDYNKYNQFVYEYALFNPTHNPLFTNNTWRVYGRFTQRFADTQSKDEKSASNIKNAYYSIEAGYSNYHSTQEDAADGANLFNYGYIGQFHQYISRAYQYQTASPGGGPAGYYQSAFQDSLLTFTPSNININGANFTSDYYKYTGAQNVTNGAQVQQGLGLLNGDRPSNIYSLWYNTGRQYNGYSTLNNSQFRVVANFSANIKNHAIQVGFEYEQRTDRYFSVNPIGLWTLMRQLANLHLTQLDLAHPILAGGTGTNPYYEYNRLYDGATQTQFDKSLRKELGLPVNGTQWLDIDSYSPSTYSLNMFSANDLLNSGSSYVTYYGYNYDGSTQTDNPTLSDYFNKVDSRGNLSREVAPFRPIYVAGYIQDHFDFKDLKFNVGVRIDRYDANQQVLKDPYLLYPAKTAAEVTNLGAIPTNIGSNYVVYVNDINNPTQIVGYRNGNTWYDSKGNQLQDPTVLALATSTGKIAPYLENASNQVLNTTSFQSYTPQINVMPRFAFSFPISDVADFFAHYDVLTQRPTAGSASGTVNRLDPFSYEYLQQLQAGSVINNPNLLPERTTDYELGFRQALNESKNSAITISAFYREIRNLIQVEGVIDAYPTTYNTYGNIDFGTVKGLTIAYDLRRTQNIRLTASYTLQFADGTGSNAAEQINLVSAGLPNLRNIIPLDYDQRNQFVTNIDYRFPSGTDYNGPTLTTHKGKDGQKTLQLLANMGANLTLRLGSGTPYSRQFNVTQGDPNLQNVAIGISQQSVLSGNPNGSNLPWQFRADLKVDKDIPLTFGKKKEGEDTRKQANLNIYLQVLNLLNTKNVLAVYRATGNPSDDGFLSSAAGQQFTAVQTSTQAFTDLYNTKVNNPSNYSLPRRIRIGVALDF